jgi:hypothetical protein
MPTQERMDIDERLKYLRLEKTHYEKANRKARSQLLDEMERITGLDRKTIIRRMNGILVRKTRTKERGRVYGPDVEAALKIIAESEDYITAERLAPNLRWMAEHLVMHDELRCSEAVLEQLQQISISTVARLLKQVHRDRPRLPRKGPTQANRCTRDVPMCRLPWNESVPGHFETDLVHHSGRSSEGEYVHTLQMVDVATGWSERVALLGRSYLVMQDAFLRILDRLPFSPLQLHPDNGSEFFNEHLFRFWGLRFPACGTLAVTPGKRTITQKSNRKTIPWFGSTSDMSDWTQLIKQMP